MINVTLSEMWYRLWILPGAWRDWGIRIMTGSGTNATEIATSPIDSMGWIALAVFAALIILSRSFNRVRGIYPA